MNKKNTKKGFTLVELMVVIAIIGLLSSIVLASLAQAKKSGQSSQVSQQLRQIQNAIELYRLDKNVVPGWTILTMGKNDLNAVLSPLLVPKYISQINLPLSGSAFNYKYYSDTSTGNALLNLNTFSNNFTCGTKKISDYLIIADAVFDVSAKPIISLSNQRLSIGGVPIDNLTTLGFGGYAYCITAN